MISSFFYFCSISLYFIINKILRLIVTKNIIKRELFMSILISTFHATVVGLMSAVSIYFNNYNIMEQFIPLFSTGYFMHDLCTIYFHLKINKQNIALILHHIGSIAIIMLREYQDDILPLWICANFTLTELTMPTLNAQWIIETYYKKTYKNLFRFNLLLYFMIRIVLCYYTYYYIIYYNYRASAILFSPFILLNSVWIVKMFQKYKKVVEYMA
jgi:hypothetical protein